MKPTRSNACPDASTFFASLATKRYRSVHFRSFFSVIVYSTHTHNNIIILESSIHPYLVRHPRPVSHASPYLPVGIYCTCELNHPFFFFFFLDSTPRKQFKLKQFASLVSLLSLVRSARESREHMAHAVSVVPGFRRFTRSTRFLPNYNTPSLALATYIGQQQIACFALRCKKQKPQFASDRGYANNSLALRRYLYVTYVCTNQSHAVKN